MNEKLPGYRTLAPGELVLISALKIDLATAILKALNDTRMHVNNQRVAQATKFRATDGEVPPYSEAGMAARAELMRIDAAQPERWIALANTHFQQGLMALVRAVAQPEGF